MKFRDVAYCGSNCTNTKCKHHFGEAEKMMAGAWWKTRSGDLPPSWPLLAFADFSEDCRDYRAPERKAS